MPTKQSYYKSADNSDEETEKKEKIRVQSLYQPFKLSDVDIDEIRR
jgi:hypothetical protein